MHEALPALQRMATAAEPQRMSRAAPVYMTAEQMGFTKQNFCWLHVFESPAFGLYVVDRGMAVVLADGASHGIRNGVTGWLTGAAACLGAADSLGAAAMGGAATGAGATAGVCTGGFAGASPFNSGLMTRCIFGCGWLPSCAAVCCG